MTLRARDFAFFLILFLTSPWVHAQTCTASSTPRTVRAGGTTELASDLVVTCTGGGVPTPNGIAVPLASFTLTSSAPVTSRPLPGQTPGNWSEALLLIDEPAPSNLLMCDDDLGVCPLTGTGTGSGTYSGSGGRYNVFQAEQTDVNQLTWSSVPFDPPGAGTRVLRFTNVRLDATVAVSFSVTVSTTAPISINNATRTVASAQTSVTAAPRAVVIGPKGVTSFNLVFSAARPNVWRTRSIAAFVDNTTSPDPVDQNMVGTVYPSETGFHDATRFTDILRSAVTQAGVAQSGTRLLVQLNDVPADVTVSVPVTVNVTSVNGTTGVATLVGDVSPDGIASFNAAFSGDLPNFDGLVFAVYEVLSSDPAQIETISVPITLTYDPASNGIPELTGSAGLGPLLSRELLYVPTFAPLQPFVVRNAPTITTSALPQGIVGQPYSLQLEATDGMAPYNWSATGLPPNLSVSKTGLLSGIPGQQGLANVNLSVVDSSDVQGSRSFTLNIVSPLSFLTTSPLLSANVLSPYQTSLLAIGGTAPYQFSIAAGSVPGLSLTSAGVLSGTPTAQGAFTLQATVSDESGQSITVPLLINVTAAPPAIKPTQVTMSFTGAVGGDQPPSQSLALVSIDQKNGAFALNLESGAARAASPSWLTVSLDQGVTPARLTVSTNPASLTAGTYTARLTISQPGNPTQAPIIIDVTFTVANTNPVLEVNPDGLQFSASRQFPQFLQKTLAVRNSGGGGAIPFTASVQQSSRWITRVSPTTGNTVRNEVQLVTVDVDPTGLGVGQYRDVIRVSSGTQNIDVPITLFIAEGGPILDLSASGVQFRTRVGSALPGTRDVKIVNRGDANSVVRWTAQKVSGGDWLTLLSTSGTATPGTPGTLSLKLSETASTRPEGSEYALIKVTDANSTGSPQYLLAVLEVSSFQSPITLDLQTSGVVFRAQPFSAMPLTQKIAFSSSTNSPVAFVASAAAENNGSWLSVTPNTGAVTAAQLSEVIVSASAANLSQGVYRGEVVIGRGDTVRAINVTLIVAQPNSAAEEKPTTSRSAACSPSSLVLTSTGMPNHFQVPAGWPTTLTVELYDDCGRPISNASVVARFSNTDPPLTLLPEDNNGTYSATWEPGTALTNVNITVRATVAGLAPSSPLLIGEVTPNRVPKLTHNGTVHNLYPQLLGALSPGVVAQIYGSDLATVTESTTSIPLATSWKGTRVLIGEYEAPLYFVSPGQLVVQFPAELKPNVPTSVVVEAPGGFTVPEDITIVNVKPGVAAFSDGRLIVQHANYKLVDGDNPARAGEVLTMYLVGMGATNPPVPSGTLSPGSGTLARPILTPTMTVGGQNANILFAGLTPFGIGLFQINFEVPLSAATGVPLDVIVKQGDESANTTTLTLTR